MTVTGNLGTSRRELRAAGRRVLSVCFGDRFGVVLFLGALVFFTSLMRIGILINDSYTVVNTMIAVADGHLYLTQLTWGNSGGSPGLHVAGGRAYGRNYGQTFLALPIVILLRIADLAFDLRVVLVAAWALLLLAFFDQLGALLDRRNSFALAGSVVAVLLFAANLFVARPIPASEIPLLALQILTLIAAGLLCVVVYRLAGSVSGRRVGRFAGAAVALATPVAFWSSALKRHTITTFALLLVVYCFHRSSTASSRPARVRFRAIAYAVVALTAWIHAPEALIMLVGLGVTELVTDDDRDWRELVLVGGTFVIALLPFLVTNLAISGNPVMPPRLLDSYPYGTPVSNFVPGYDPSPLPSSEPSSGQTTPSNGGSSDGGSTVFGVLVGVGSRFLERVFGNAALLLDWSHLFQVFVRSGYVAETVSGDMMRAIRLSMVESMPLLGAMVAVPVVAFRRFKRGVGLQTFREDPVVATDLLLGVYTALFVLIYIPRVPNNAQFTVRYLHPLYPVAVYALVRVEPIQRVLDEEWRLLAWSYSGILLIGGQVFVVVSATVARSLSEAVQFHALTALFAATCLLVWTCGTSYRPGYERTGALTLGFVSAVSTLFLVLSATYYYALSGEYAVPLSRVFAEILSRL